MIIMSFKRRISDECKNDINVMCAKMARFSLCASNIEEEWLEMRERIMVIKKLYEVKINYIN